MNPFAQSGFSKAAAYDAHRPSFPTESVNVLLENLRISGVSGATVVDLAAGTGKFTEILAKRDEQYKIIAVEPHKDMRQVLADKKLNSVTVKDGVATKLPLNNGSVDAVTAAQAFHWFSNMESLKEIHRVLQPHGAYGMIWNIEDYNAPKSTKAASSWEQTMQDFVWSLDDDQPRFRHEKWRKVFDDQIKSNPFSLTASADPLFALPLAENVERWEVWLPKDSIWERLNTLSQISVLDSEAKDNAQKLFNDAINRDDVEVNDKGEVAIHGATYSYWTTKVPVAGDD